MKEISTEIIAETVKELCIDACYNLGDDVKQALNRALQKEESDTAKSILRQLIENAEYAACQNMPLCQDTGMTVVFIELGQDVHIVGGGFYDAINEGVRRGYTQGYLRKSVVKDPFNRVNTGDNTPAIIHTDIVQGDSLKITVAPKGFGSENMSRLKMLKPAQGMDGVKEFVIDTVIKAGANPCPPIIVGVGMGGTMEKAAYLAKKSLIRRLGDSNAHADIKKLEDYLLEKINKTGIGPQGLGGRTTALAVHCETSATHIAGLPVAVNIQCHSARHKQAIL
ncbi:MAG: fumarate hydratase [Clostridia bacterium]|nr:fumarate hydratase [Clostridia bacterium]